MPGSALEKVMKASHILTITAVAALSVASTQAANRPGSKSPSPSQAVSDVYEKDGTLFYSGRVPQAPVLYDKYDNTSESEAALAKREGQPLRNPSEISPAQRKADALFQTAEILYKKQNPEAVGAFEKAASAGATLAYYRLASIYGGGKFKVEKNMGKALEYYKKGASKGDIACLDHLGDLFAEGGEGIEKNAPMAVGYYQAGLKIAQGSPETRQAIASKLQKFYEAGVGLPKDREGAIKAWEAIEPLVESPSTALPQLYLFKAEKAEKSDEAEEAIKYYKKAAKSLAANVSNPEAVYLLSVLYAEGKGVSQDVGKAKELLNEAASGGSLAAKFEVERPVVRVNDAPPEEAMLKIVMDAAAAGSPQAQTELAILLLKGSGTEKNTSRALALLKSAAQHGNPDAEYELGKIYASGSLGDRNRKRALDLFELSAGQGHSCAALEAALLHKREVAGKPEPDKILSFLKQAADGGEGAAHLELAKIVSSGRLVPPDATVAAQHYLKAAELENKEARMVVLKSFFNKEPVSPITSQDKPLAKTIAEEIQSQADKASIFEWAKQYAESGPSIAQYYLGTCYNEGIGTEKDLDKALDYFAQASGTKKTSVISPEDAKEFCDLLKTGDYDAIRSFLKKNPDFARGEFEFGACITNALGAARSLVPKSDSRLNIFRLLIKSGADPKFIIRNHRDDSVTYNVVSYPENLTVSETEYLLSVGADPNKGVCMPMEPPILRLVKMYMEERAEEDSNKRADTLAKIRLFIKYGADPYREAGTSSPCEINKIEIEKPTANRIAEALGAEDLIQALRKEE